MGESDGKFEGQMIPMYERVVEGEWQLRATAYDAQGQVVERVEATTRLDWQAAIAVDAPSFLGVPIGITSIERRLRIENWSWGPLRIKSVSLPAGSELAIADDGCAGQTLYMVQGCYVSLTYTAATLGQHRATLLVDANAPTKEIYFLVEGIPNQEMELAADPKPSPTPTPTPVATTPPVPPELAFGAAPGRTSTRLSGFKLENVPAGSTVSVMCAKGCSARSFTKSGASGTVSLRQFVKRALKVGTTIQITVAEPGKPVRAATLKIRARREPKVTGNL